MLTRRLLLALATTTVLGACEEPDAGVGPAAASVTYRWMQCHDCMNGERAAVLALGDATVPLLRKILHEGPPDAHVAAAGRSLHQLAGRSPGGDAPSFQTRVFELASLRSMYQRRAISALEGIGTPEAAAALCDAPQRRTARAGSSPALTRALDRAILRLSRPCP